MADGVLCPRCGRARLIRRHEMLPTLRPGDVPLLRYLRWRLRGRPAVTRRRYHCEMCGHDWEVYEWARRA